MSEALSDRLAGSFLKERDGESFFGQNPHAKEISDNSTSHISLRHAAAFIMNGTAALVPEVDLDVTQEREPSVTSTSRDRQCSRSCVFITG
jgi:hypothetical protein